MNALEKILFRFKSREKQFSYIYKKHLWGGNSKFYSGSGSHNDFLVSEFVDQVKLKVSQKRIKSCVEIGCGDFNVGDKYAQLFDRYVGVDIVESLIINNNLQFGTKSISFIKADAVTEDLPGAELLIIRQVLQHLSNEEILSVLSKLGDYKYAIIGETQYRRELADAYNLDIDSTRNTRRNKKSGVYLEDEPFCIQCDIIRRVKYSDTVDFVVYWIEKSR